LGVLGLVFARPRREGFLIWASFVPLTVLSVVVFFVAARYRLPYQAALVVAAGGGASWLFDRVRARAWQPLIFATLTAAVTLAVVVWPTGLDDGRAEERLRIGLFELEQGRVTEGESWIARAVATHGFPGVAHFRAGQLHESKGRPGDALTHYQLAIALDPAQPELHVAAARVLNEMKRPDQAIAELDRTEPGELDDSVAREYERAGLALVLSGRTSDAVDVFAKAIARRPRVASFHLNRAVALAMAGRTPEARAEAQTALTLDPGYEKAKELLRTLRTP
jgi:tetratricopeptide (TPR) repeat protein